MEHKKTNIKQMAVVGVMTAVICILSPFALNIVISPVPVSLCSMAIYFVLTVLGRNRGTLCVVLYILLGLAGLPVFTYFTGGGGKLFGPTGGYIIGYVFLALIFGTFLERWEHPAMHIIGGVLGTVALYFFGTVWLAYQLHLNFMAALWAGVIPYIPGDIAKLAIAMTVGTQLRRRLLQAQLL